MTTDEFYRRYWEQEVLFLPFNDSSKFSDLLTLDDVDEFLARSDLRVPAIRLVKAGGQIPIHEYTTSFSLGGYRATDLIRTDRVLANYQAGATILIQLANWSLPSLKPFATRLEKYFGFNVEMNVYLTPPNSQGFSAHFDTHSVFALQLCGEKTWQLHGRRPVQPILTDRFDSSIETPGAVEHELEMTPGSFLYIPRGRFHSARANAEPSLHVTIGLFPPSWLDVFHARVAQLADDPRFRLAPSPIDHTNHSEELLREFSKGFSVESLRSGIRKAGYSVENQPSRGRLLGTLASAALTLDTRIRIRSEATFHVEVDDEKVTIHGMGSLATFPLRAQPLLSILLSNTRTFCLSEVQSDFDDQSLLVVTKALLRFGFLVLVPHSDA